jgi:hypothetical protein
MLGNGQRVVVRDAETDQDITSAIIARSQSTLH